MLCRGTPSAFAVIATTAADSNIWNTAAAGSRWEDGLQSPPSLGSSSSQFSSSVDSDFGGAAVTPQDTTPVVRRDSGLFVYGDIEAGTDDDPGDGTSLGMQIDECSVPAGVMYPSPAVAVDELHPSNFTSRPVSPVGGAPAGSVQLPGGSGGESEVPSTSALHLTSAMQLDEEDEPAPPISAFGLFPSAPPSPVTPPGPESAAPFSGPSSPYSDVATAASGDEGEEEEQVTYILDNLPPDGIPLASPPTMPTPIAEFVSNYTPASFLENNPHIFAYPEYITTTTFFPDLLMHPPTVAPVATLVNLVATHVPNPFDDYDEHPNDVVFDDALVTQDMDKYNLDFANFCGQLWHSQVPSFRDHYRISSHTPPHISSEGLNIAEWSRARPAEITREDVENGSDIQGIQWDKLELGRKAARKWRQARYINYRNIPDFPREARVYYSFLSFRRWLGSTKNDCSRSQSSRTVNSSHSSDTILSDAG